MYYTVNVIFVYVLQKHAEIIVQLKIIFTPKTLLIDMVLIFISFSLVNY